MNGRERGFLLLSSHLGCPDRKPLTTAQLRFLAERMRDAEIPTADRDLTERDLLDLGYGPDMARRIVQLLSEEEVLDYYAQRGGRFGCVPVTRVSEAYPLLLRRRLGLDSPGVLWAKGDLSLLSEPAVALVGSRELREDNARFAAEVGRQAARQDYVLVSGNARGADRTAQSTCLEAGGRVISIVADEVARQPLRKNMLFLSEDGYDEPFSVHRALSRNRCIHGLGLKTFVAQSGMKTGGTWDGTVKNLRFGWSSVYCYDDGSEGMGLLADMGATLIGPESLASFYELPEPEHCLFDR